MQYNNNYDDDASHKNKDHAAAHGVGKEMIKISCIHYDDILSFCAQGNES
jgi:hypothetical protein